MMNHPIERSTLATMLTESVQTITFNKVNGDQRVMNCTLMSKYLPAPATTEPSKKVNEEVLSVWDVDAQGYRSFRMNNITNVETPQSWCS